MGSKWDHDPSSDFFIHEDQTSSICVIMPKIERQTKGHENNTSLEEVITIFVCTTKFN